MNDKSKILLVISTLTEIAESAVDQAEEKEKMVQSFRLKNEDLSRLELQGQHMIKRLNSDIGTCKNALSVTISKEQTIINEMELLLVKLKDVKTKPTATQRRTIIMIQSWIDFMKKDQSLFRSIVDPPKQDLGKIVGVYFAKPEERTVGNYANQINEKIENESR